MPFLRKATQPAPPAAKTLTLALKHGKTQWLTGDLSSTWMWQPIFKAKNFKEKENNVQKLINILTEICLPWAVC